MIGHTHKLLTVLSVHAYVLNISQDKIFVVYVWPAKIFNLENFRMLVTWLLFGFHATAHVGSDFSCMDLNKVCDHDQIWEKGALHAFPEILFK